MSDDGQASRDVSTAHPFSDDEQQEFERRFADYEYDLLGGDNDVDWPTDTGQ